MYKIYQLFRIIYWPFLIWAGPLLSRSLRKRLAFERRNALDLCCRSFKSDGKQAYAAFEVSSEGELEQVRPLIEELLIKGESIELVFASDSVEKQCLKLVQDFPGNLRVLRFPLLSYFPGRSKQDIGAWLTAKKLVLCRYDFFPSLLAYGAREDVEFILTSASLKSYEYKGRLAKALLAKIYKKFDRIIAATELDRQRFIDNIGLAPETLFTFDFRPLAIKKRLDQKGKKLSATFPAHEAFLNSLKNYDIKKRIVFGSFWEEEAKVFDATWDFSESFVCLFPHRLDFASLASLYNKLSEKIEAPIYRLGSDEGKNLKALREFKENPGPLIVEIKGVLLESYSDFGTAFVGGGHGVSVHSLMEPFMAGCFVMCGPKVFRSTEYDLIREHNPDRAQIVDSLEDVSENFRKSWTREFSDHANFIETFSSDVKRPMKFIGL